MKVKLIAIFSLCLFGFSVPEEDADTIRRIYNASLTHGSSYENLSQLCKEVGHRLTGSHGDSLAVRWSEAKMKAMGYANVRLQPFQANFWKRGKAATGMVFMGNEVRDISVLALGSSVGTGNKTIRGGLIEIDQWDELEKYKDDINGKIVFYNRPMNPKRINTFMAYGESVDQRSRGAVEGAKYGAIASLVRSMTLSNDDFPHTGNMGYDADIVKIPGLAVSAHDADELHELLQDHPGLEVELSAGCENLGLVETNNVIGEIRGSEHPDRIIVVGGHLDSWDVGEGAHDDGAGIVHALEVIHLLREARYKPRNTIRCVLFMNEENGVGGGRTYAAAALKKGEKHIAAIESDAGGFTPRGFHADGMEGVEKRAYEKLTTWKDLFEPYNLHYFAQRHAGTDIGPLKEQGTALFGLIPDSQRYFDFHHTNADVLEAVNKRELELGSAAIASLVYLIDKYGME